MQLTLRRITLRAKLLKKEKTRQLFQNSNMLSLNSIHYSHF